MTKHISDTARWLSAYLASGDATPESRVFRAARQAGHDHRDIRRAARLLGVEVFPGSVSSWWRLPRPPSGSTPMLAPMPQYPKPHQRPSAEAGA
jgi:hypothetical protein